jgi:hypothetical protein
MKKLYEGLITAVVLVLAVIMLTIVFSNDYKAKVSCERVCNPLSVFNCFEHDDNLYAVCANFEVREVK